MASISRKRTPPSKPIAIDLFAGSGGLTMGLKLAGYRVVGAVERNELAAKTYCRNHRATVMWNQDIRRVSASAFKKSLRVGSRRLDLVAGCPPCQGFSSLRTLNGGRQVRDHRNDLIFEFLRFVRVLRPRAVMLENVPRLARNSRRRRLTSKLKRLGYAVEHKVLDVAKFDVPQRRMRFVLVGVRGGQITWPQEAPNVRTVRDAIGALPRPGKTGDSLHDMREKRAEKVKRVIALIPKNGGSRIDIGQRRQLRCHQRCDGFKDIYGRMSWDSVAPTITTGCVNPSKGRFLHPTQNRAITLREAALLQTFPSRYWFSTKRGKFAVAEQIGNALPPEFAKRHALALKKTLVEIQGKRRGRNG